MTTLAGDTPISGDAMLALHDALPISTGTRAGAAAAAGRVAWAAGSPAGGFEGPRESGVALATGLAAVGVAPGALRIVGFAASAGVVSSSSMIWPRGSRAQPWPTPRSWPSS